MLEQAFLGIGDGWHMEFMQCLEEKRSQKGGWRFSKVMPREVRKNGVFSGPDLGRLTLPARILG